MSGTIQKTSPKGESPNEVFHPPLPSYITVSANEGTPLLRRADGYYLTPQEMAQERRRELGGIALLTISAVGFSSMALLVKIGAADFPAFEMVFVRSVVQLGLGLFACLFMQINPLGPKDARGWLLLRGFAGAVGLALFFYALTILPLADATTIFFLGPLFTAVLARCFLSEPFTLFDAFCAILTSAGVILVSKPAFLFVNLPPPTDNIYNPKPGPPDESDIRFIAIICALAGTATSAVGYVTVRQVGRRAHFLVHVVYFGFVASVLSPIALWLLQEPRLPETENHYFTLVGIGVLAFLGQCFLNRGLQMASSCSATLMRVLDIAFAFALQILVLHDEIDTYEVAGASLITVFTTGVAWSRSKAEDSVRELRRSKSRSRSRSRSSRRDNTTEESRARDEIVNAESGDAIV